MTLMPAKYTILNCGCGRKATDCPTGGRAKVLTADLEAETETPLSKENRGESRKNRKWFGSMACLNYARETWGCPGFYAKKGAGRPKLERRT